MAKQTTWHNIVSWNLSAFYVVQLVKGAKFFVSVRIEHRKYESTDGT